MFALASQVRRGHGRRAAAFSLAEMMIALVILGFGLIVVGAALPVGLTYTRDTIDRATGDAAAEYALDVIEQNVRLRQDPWQETTATPLYRTDVFRPRELLTGELAMDTSDPNNPRLWEPVIKVRPLLSVSIDPTDLSEPPDSGADGTPYRAIEEQIALWVGFYPYLEHDQYRVGYINWTGPCLPSIAAVYPPVSNDLPLTAGEFLSNIPGGSQYTPYPVNQEARRKAANSPITWVAFYRRVSYAQGSDPHLYEVIAVATRRPSTGWRCPRFVPQAGAVPGLGRESGATTSDNLELADGSTLAPVPWLVVFDSDGTTPFPWLQEGVDYVEMPDGDRVLAPGFTEPSELRFLCGPSDGQLLPRGSIFIPAVNDRQPSLYNGGAGGSVLDPVVKRGGFVPHAPDTLPIYEVVGREQRSDGKYVVSVKNNGFYPWAYNDYAPFWPVWVIPPAFKELDGNDNPVYDDRSPILAVTRRVIRFTEVP